MFSEGSPTIAILGFGCLFFMLGFGLGRLRFHALTAQVRRSRTRLKRDRVFHFTPPYALDVWSAIYQQTLQSARDLYKGNATIGTIGLAATATIIASTGKKPLLLYFTTGFFVIAATLAMAPLSDITQKLFRDLDKTGSRYKKGMRKFIILPVPLKNKRHPISMFLAHLFLGLASIALTYSVLAIPSCQESQRMINNFLFQCY